MIPEDYYELLGVEPTATADEITAAYRRLAKQTHPDVNKTPWAEDLFQKINTAYATLSNPRKRELYDLSRREAAVSQTRTPPPGYAQSSYRGGYQSTDPYSTSYHSPYGESANYSQRYTEANESVPPAPDQDVKPKGANFIWHLALFGLLFLTNWLAFRFFNNTSDFWDYSSANALCLAMLILSSIWFLILRKYLNTFWCILCSLILGGVLMILFGFMVAYLLPPGEPV